MINRRISPVTFIRREDHWVGGEYRRKNDCNVDYFPVNSIAHLEEHHRDHAYGSYQPNKTRQRTPPVADHAEILQWRPRHHRRYERFCDCRPAVVTAAADRVQRNRKGARLVACTTADGQDEPRLESDLSPRRLKPGPAVTL